MDSKYSKADEVSILLVDDKPANLIALESFLSIEGYDIVSATSGKEALHLLSSRPFAVILTDVMMPEMDGFELARQIKSDAHFREIPIIFLTAMVSDRADVFQGYAAGIVDYMQKPLEPEIVKAKVAVFAQLFRQKRLIERQSQQLLANERREQASRLSLIEQKAALDREQAAAIHRELTMRIELHLALAEIGRLSLLSRSLEDVMLHAAAMIQNTLKVDQSILLTLNHDATASLHVSGRIWQGVRTSRLKMDRDQQLGVQTALVEREPLVFTESSRDALGTLLQSLGEETPSGGVSMIVYGEKRPFGALSLYHSGHRSWNIDELSFLKSVSKFLSIACERIKSEEAVRELTRSNVELESFSFAASHDLQEPLRKIISFSQLLTEEYRDKVDENGQMYLEYIVDGAKRMKALIDDLLDLSRVGTGDLSPEPESLDLILAQALKNLEVKVHESKARIKIGPMPVVRVKASEFLRLFQNLISNALKYRTQAAPEIEVSCRADGQNWIFCVSDHGIGIKPEYLEKIFVLFRRLHGRNEFPGTGIGLAICKKIVEQHGGRIWAESSGQDGSRFYFTLPCPERQELDEDLRREAS